ncbi:MAG: pantetheine-phosphate adenylyltransferase [Candidatus Paceibacterota bacterium]|jgi:pantetheine-phosphate adenylyltransferase
MKTRKVVYAASLDPITNGHLNVIERFAPLYDEFIVVVAVDARKTYMFTPEERVSMTKSAVAHISNVTVDVCIGRYVVKYAESVGAQVIIRGLRNFKDLEDEQVLAEENRRICSTIETIWVPCLPNLMHISSSMVKGHVGIDPDWEEQVVRSVPSIVVTKLKEKYMLNRAKKHWASLMALLGNPKGSELVFAELLLKYSEPHRAYHTLEHVVNMLDELESVVDKLNDKDAVKMAVWYHDVVYDPMTKDHHVVADNEVRSAYRAELDLEKLGLSSNFSERVQALIMATTHTEKVTDSDTMFMVDLDLAILGKSEKEFESYEKGIRKEYDWVSEADFCVGRSKVLESFLNRETVYSTEVFRSRYENTARKNMEKSLTLLKQ